MRSLLTLLLSLIISCGQYIQSANTFDQARFYMIHYKDYSTRHNPQFGYTIEKKSEHRSHYAIRKALMHENAVFSFHNRPGKMLQVIPQSKALTYAAEFLKEGLSVNEALSKWAGSKLDSSKEYAVKAVIKWHPKTITALYFYDAYNNPLGFRPYNKGQSSIHAIKKAYANDHFIDLTNLHILERK